MMHLGQTLEHTRLYKKAEWANSVKNPTNVTEICLLLPNNYTIVLYFDSGMSYKQSYSSLRIYYLIKSSKLRHISCINYSVASLPLLV